MSRSKGARKPCNVQEARKRLIDDIGRLASAARLDVTDWRDLVVAADELRT